MVFQVHLENEGQSYQQASDQTSLDDAEIMQHMQLIYEAQVRMVLSQWIKKSRQQSTEIAEITAQKDKLIETVNELQARSTVREQATTGYSEREGGCMKCIMHKTIDQVSSIAKVGGEPYVRLGPLDFSVLDTFISRLISLGVFATSLAMAILVLVK
jgi:hypothetical protein